MSPANSAGYMDGGIDRAYCQHFGSVVQTTIQESIARTADGNFLVGSSLLVETGNDQVPYMLCVPTMGSPDAIRPSNCFYAMSAILNAMERFSNRITEVYSSGLGTGVGQVDPHEAANEMANAYRKNLDRSTN